MTFGSHLRTLYYRVVSHSFKETTVWITRDPLSVTLNDKRIPFTLAQTGRVWNFHLPRRARSSGFDFIYSKTVRLQTDGETFVLFQADCSEVCLSYCAVVSYLLLNVTVRSIFSHSHCMESDPNP